MFLSPAILAEELVDLGRARHRRDGYIAAARESVASLSG
jgi:hypothetical protein